MGLLAHADIIDNCQSLLGGNTTDFTDAFLTSRIVEVLTEFSRYCPFIVRETLCTTEDSKELDISFITNMLWIQALEYRVNRLDREWRNFVEHYRHTLSMKIDWWPADTDSGIDTDEALDNSETGVDCDADATDDIPVGTIIRVENELMYVTATGESLTVVRGYNQTEAVAHTTNQDIMIPELAYLYVAKQHLIPPLTDLAGAVDLPASGYSASARTIHVDSLGSSDTLYKDYLFTIASDGSGTVYRLTEDTTLSSNEGDITFTPGLVEDITDGDVVTFKNSSFESSRQETLFIDLLSARAAISISTKFINTLDLSSKTAWRDWLAWGREHLAITLAALEKESLKYRKPYKIHSRDYSSLSEVT